MTAKELRQRAREKLFPRDGKTGYGTFLLGMLRQFAFVMLASFVALPAFVGIWTAIDTASLKEKMDLIPPLPFEVGYAAQTSYQFLSAIVQDIPPPHDIGLIMLFVSLALLCVLLVFAFVKFGQRTMAVALMRGGLRASHATTGIKNILRMSSLMVWQQTYISLWLLLFLIPGIRAFYSYSMASYLLIDNPDWSPRKCIAESKRMMEGNRWRLFCLQVSFWGWMLLSKFLQKFAGGLSSWLLVPYTETANAAFYEDLLDREETNQSGCEPPADGDFTKNLTNQYEGN